MKFREFLSRTFSVRQTITIRQDNEITCIVASIYNMHNNTIRNFTITKTEVLDPCTSSNLISEYCVNLRPKILEVKDKNMSSYIDVYHIQADGRGVITLN